MSEWKNPHTNPPPEGVVVEVKGADYTGEWIMKMIRKDYKEKPSNIKPRYKANGKFWRWVYAEGKSTGYPVGIKDTPESWRRIMDGDQ